MTIGKKVESDFGGAGKTLDIGSKGVGQTSKKIYRGVELAPLDKADCIAGTVCAFGELLLRPAFGMAPTANFTSDPLAEF